MNTAPNRFRQQPVIISLADTDLYKATQQQYALNNAPDAVVDIEFKCRTPAIDLRPYIGEIREEIANLCTLRFSMSELDWMAKQPYFKKSYLSFLSTFQLDDRNIRISASKDQLEININGLWKDVILFEVPVMAIVSEVYFRNNQQPGEDMTEARRRLEDKINFLKAKDDPDFNLIEFGTRRRFSREWQAEVVTRLARELPTNFRGTSNMYLAQQLDVPCVGTMAHESLQVAQVVMKANLADFQSAFFESWAQEFRGQLGIALTDIISMDSFTNQFDGYLSRLYDGMRQDSGCPFEWGRKAIQHYRSMGIDAKTKKALWSDGLDIQQAWDIYQAFGDQIQSYFCLGTNLTNDCGYKAINMVIKVVRCNGRSVAKVSDEPGKTLCKDIEYLNYLLKVHQQPIRYNENGEAVAINNKAA